MASTIQPCVSMWAGVASPAGGCRYFSRSYPVAAIMVGIESRNENSSAAVRENPEICPAAMVTMEREVPGKHCGKVLAKADPNGRPESHFLDFFRCGALERPSFMRPVEGVDHPHDDAADQQRSSHQHEVFQILPDHLLEQERRACRADERNCGQAQRVRQDGAVAAPALRKRLKETGNAAVEEDRQAEDGAQLDHDGEHLPVAVFEIDSEQGLSDAQMGGGTDRQELGEALDDAKDQGKQIIVQDRILAQWLRSAFEFGRGGLGMPVVDGHGVAGRGSTGLFAVIERHFATAAVAAAIALFAQMIAARIFGATNADTRRFFFTDAADERHILRLLIGAPGRLARNGGAAALRFTVYYQVFLVFLIGQVEDVVL